MKEKSRNSKVKAKEIHYQQNCSTKNAKGNPSDWNERTLDSKSKSCEKINISVKGKYIDK